MQPIPIFVGYDPRETVAWHVLCHSLLARASVPITITPLALGNLRSVFTRTRDPLQSTDFAFSRFLVPSLCDHQGWAIFMDCDMLARDDIADLWKLRDERFAVMCVQHDHVPVEDVKFLNARQTRYPKKNWSSLMLFNNAKCKALSQEYVHSASGLQLHQFKWLGDDSMIGQVPHGWNHLVGYDRYDPDASLIHFTDGGPYFHEYAACDYAQEWFAERERMLRVDQRGVLASRAPSLQAPSLHALASGGLHDGRADLAKQGRTLR